MTAKCQYTKLYTSIILQGVSKLWQKTTIWVILYNIAIRQNSYVLKQFSEISMKESTNLKIGWKIKNLLNINLRPNFSVAEFCAGEYRRD